jgi:hypothetical protein
MLAALVYAVENLYPNHIGGEAVLAVAAEHFLTSCDSLPVMDTVADPRRRIPRRVYHGLVR